VRSGWTGGKCWQASRPLALARWLADVFGDEVAAHCGCWKPARHWYIFHLIDVLYHFRSLFRCGIVFSTGAILMSGCKVSSSKSDCDLQPLIP
jgi:hypothetical protein